MVLCSYNDVFYMNSNVTAVPNFTCIYLQTIESHKRAESKFSIGFQLEYVRHCMTYIMIDIFYSTVRVRFIIGREIYWRLTKTFVLLVFGKYNILYCSLRLGRCFNTDNDNRTNKYKIRRGRQRNKNENDDRL